MMAVTLHPLSVHTTLKVEDSHPLKFNMMLCTSRLLLTLDHMLVTYNTNLVNLAGITLVNLN